MLAISVMQTKHKSTKGLAKVRLVSGRIIECVLAGAITGPIVEQSVKETETLVKVVRDKGEEPLLFIDMKELASQDSGARSEAKRLAKMGIKKIAIYGAKPGLTTIGRYITQISGMQEYTRFFKNRRGALKWLEQPKEPKKPRKQLALQLASVIVGLIGFGVFVGWMTNNEILVALHPSLKAMNPVTSVNVMLLAGALYLFVRRTRSKVQLGILRMIIAWLALYGVVVLYGYVMSVQTGIDAWLFTEKLGTLGAVKAQASEVTAVLFLLMAIMMAAGFSGLRKSWLLYVFRFSTLVVGLIIAGVFIGYAFGLARLYGVLVVPVPVFTAVSFLIATSVVVGALYTPKLFPFARRFLRLYWSGTVVFIAIVFLTSLVWRQMLTSIDQNSNLQAQQTFEKTVSAVESRVGSYVDVLHGFKAFFESSSDVEMSEYKTYFDKSGVQQNYPGFNAISFIRYVRPDERLFVQNSMRQQANESPVLKDFTIAPGSDIQYVLSYIEPNPINSTTSLGTNIGVLAGRKATFDWARDNGQPRASDIISFTSGNEKGFLITIPIYKAETVSSTVAERQRNIYGFVNAVFRNEVVFKEVFSSLDLGEDVAFRITTASGVPIYQSSTMGDQVDFTDPRLTQVIDVAGQKWTVAMQTTATYGRPEAVQMSSWLVLGSGLTLALVAGFLMASLSRRRDRALELASSMTEDLNNERNAAEAVRQKDEAILASIGDAVFAVDRHKNIVLFNPAAVAISGYDQSEAIGKPYEEILSFIVEKTGEQDVSFVEHALAGKPSRMKADTLLERRDGTRIAVADSAAPIRDSDGSLIGAIVIFRDVSKERALDQAKSEFVSLASHQLRTPLSAINWYSEMLLGGDAGKLNAEQSEYMKEIFEGNQRMVELVDSLLNVSRLEVGKLKNEPKDTSLIELADSLQKELRTSVIAKKMNMKQDVESKLPTVSADPKLLRMVLQNLLSNAVKYTPEKGTVTLTMKRADHAIIAKMKLRPAREYVYISVSDTGYGIPKEQQPKIFEKLFRADNVRKLDVEGTGLGLYIVKAVAEKLDGAVWFESEEGKGTTFYVVLPTITRPS